MDTSKLQDFRLLLLGDKNDDSQDDLINLIYKMAESRLLFLINTALRGFELPPIILPIPDDLQWITDEVAIKRFNRIGSEGFTSQSVEGHSISFSTNDFGDYLADISAFLDPGIEGYTKGKAVFI